MAPKHHSRVMPAMAPMFDENPSTPLTTSPLALSPQIPHEQLELADAMVPLRARFFAGMHVGSDATDVAGEAPRPGFFARRAGASDVAALLALTIVTRLTRGALPARTNAEGKPCRFRKQRHAGKHVQPAPLGTRGRLSVGERKESKRARRNDAAHFHLRCLLLVLEWCEQVIPDKLHARTTSQVSGWRGHDAHGMASHRRPLSRRSCPQCLSDPCLTLGTSKQGTPLPQLSRLPMAYASTLVPTATRRLWSALCDGL